MIEITDIAKKKLKEVLDNNPGKLLRIFMQGHGWGGPQLGLALDEPNVDETPKQVHGFEILIADDIKNYAYGSRVNYEMSPYYEGFVIKNGDSSC